MPVTADPRLIELKLLQNLADGTWRDGVCTAAAAGQGTALGLSQGIYADLLVTLHEDGLLTIGAGDIRNRLDDYERHKMTAFRESVIRMLSASNVFHQVTVTYRGLRRIDELRDQLRRDRVLERFR